MELSWLDFDREDRKQVMQIIGMLEEKGTVDELGFGVIRNYFANKFFPGTTTLQTRAKYFVLCPYIFKELEKREPAQNTEQYFKNLAREESICARKLLSKEKEEQGEAKGIIGSTRLQHGEWVKRAPSDIYWNGLRQYQIFNPPNTTLKNITRNTYANMMTKEEREQYWDIDEIYYKEWKKDLEKENSISLTKKEAEYLRKQIMKAQKDSLLAKCIEDGIIEKFTQIQIESEEISAFEQFGEIVYSLDITKELKDEYMLAKNMADFLYCALIRYNCKLFKNENEEVQIKWEQYKPNMKKYAEEIDKIPDLKLLEITNNKILTDFIKNLKQAMLLGDIEEIDKLVEEREKYHKKKRAKLTNPNYEPNKQWIGLGKLQYRIEQAINLARDIKEGLDKC